MAAEMACQSVRGKRGNSRLLADLQVVREVEYESDQGRTFVGEVIDSLALKGLVQRAALGTRLAVSTDHLLRLCGGGLRCLQRERQLRKTMMMKGVAKVQRSLPFCR